MSPQDQAPRRLRYIRKNFHLRWELVFQAFSRMPKFPASLRQTTACPQFLEGVTLWHEPHRRRQLCWRWFTLFTVGWESPGCLPLLVEWSMPAEGHGSSMTNSCYRCETQVSNGLTKDTDLIYPRVFVRCLRWLDYFSFDRRTIVGSVGTEFTRQRIPKSAHDHLQSRTQPFRWPFDLWDISVKGSGITAGFSALDLWKRATADLSYPMCGCNQPTGWRPSSRASPS
jgi:hypothetical protein